MLAHVLDSRFRGSDRSSFVNSVRWNFAIVLFL